MLRAGAHNELTSQAAGLEISVHTPAEELSALCKTHGIEVEKITNDDLGPYFLQLLRPFVLTMSQRPDHPDRRAPKRFSRSR